MESNRVREQATGDHGDQPVAQGARQGAQRPRDRALPALARARAADERPAPAPFRPSRERRHRAGRGPGSLPLQGATRGGQEARSGRRHGGSDRRKNRNGPTDKILLTWLGNFMRFEDFDPRFRRFDAPATRSRFVCSSCGGTTLRWAGHAGMRRMDSLVEEVLERAARPDAGPRPRRARPWPVVDVAEVDRVSTGVPEPTGCWGAGSCPGGSSAGWRAGYRKIDTAPPGRGPAGSGGPPRPVPRG